MTDTGVSVAFTIIQDRGDNVSYPVSLLSCQFPRIAGRTLCHHETILQRPVSRLFNHPG